MKRVTAWAVAAATAAAALAVVGSHPRSASVPGYAAALPAAGALLDTARVSDAVTVRPGVGHAVLMPEADHVDPVTFLAAPTCLSTAELKNRAFVGTTVDWATGTADFVTRLPLCPGVDLQGSGATFTFVLGAAPAGSGHPNRPLWPQDRTAATGWQTLSAAAGHHRFAFPRVADQCSQTDVGLWSNGWNRTWPAVLARPGVPQPYGLAFYVGTGRGCFTPPAISVVSRCAPIGCTGVASVIVTASNPNGYATARVWLLVGSTKVVSLLLAPGRSATATVSLADGIRYRFHYQLSFGTSGPELAIGAVYEVRCPPSPNIQFLVNCPCAGDLTGTITDLNATRYTHVITVTLPDGMSRSVTVPPGATRTVSGLSWARGGTVVVDVQSYLGGARVGPVARVATLDVS